MARRPPARRRGRGPGRGRRSPRSRRAGSAGAAPSSKPPSGSELVDGDLLGLGRHLLAAAGQLVVLDPLDLLGGVGGRLLLDLPLEARPWPRPPPPGAAPRPPRPAPRRSPGRRRRRCRWRRRSGRPPRRPWAPGSGTGSAGSPLPSVSSSRPVASGSSVPQWPIFFCLRTRRTFCTASCEVKPGSLSSSSSPSFISRHDRSSAARGSSRRPPARRTSSPSPASVKPAALRWPPPPWWRAIFSTSTSPRLRSDTLWRAVLALADQRHRVHAGDRARVVDQPLGVAGRGAGLLEHLAASARRWRPARLVQLEASAASRRPGARTASGWLS